MFLGYHVVFAPPPRTPRDERSTAIALQLLTTGTLAAMLAAVMSLASLFAFAGAYLCGNTICLESPDHNLAQYSTLDSTR